MKLRPTDCELTDGLLNPGTVETARRALSEEGYVILEDVVAHDHLDRIHERMIEDYHQLLTATILPVNFAEGHIQQDPPPFAPYIFRDIVSNPFAVQITKAVLGDDLYNSFYSGNTNCPGSHQQPVHADKGQYWEGLSVAHPAISLVVNIATVDVTEANGSIELWPGSHLNTCISKFHPTGKIDPVVLEARRPLHPPIRGNTRKGSILIRDIRLWHRGMPNPSRQPRFMIAMIHNVAWLRPERILQFQRGCEAEFEGCELDPNADFVDGPIHYLFRNHSFDYPAKS